MDKFQQIAWNAQTAVVILGNGSEFELVDVSAAGLSEQRKRELLERNFGFFGIIGIVQGFPRVALAVPLDEMTLSALSQAFIKRIEDVINASVQPKQDGVEWLTRLYQMRDTRDN